MPYYENKPPEYIIYTFIEDHVRRLYITCDFFDKCALFYKYNRSHQLREYNKIEMLFWNSLFLREYYFNHINKFLKEGTPFWNLNDKVSFLKDHFIALNNEINNNFPNTKFILFIYNGDNYIKQIEKDLINQNIYVIYLSDLSKINFNDSKYVIDSMGHPSETAWDTIVPLLVKKINNIKNK